MEKLLARLDLSPDSPYLHFDNPQTISDIIQIYVRIVQAHTKKTICDLRALAALYELCSLICEEKLPKSFEAAVPLTYSVHIDKALTYIENNYSKKELSLTEVADYLNLHPNYFSTLFHESTKMRFSDYLRQFRVHMAMEIIDSGNYYIKEISDMVGYSDPLHFSKEFKKVIHMSPSAYTKKYIY